MLLINHTSFSIIAEAFLPDNANRRLRAFSCYNYLMAVAPPDDALTAEFRLTLLAAINDNPRFGTAIAFQALYLITRNPVLHNIPAILDLYAEILRSDPSLLTAYDDRHGNLVFSATIYDRPLLLQILQQQNAPMHEVIRVAIPLGDDPTCEFQFLQVGEIAAQAYLRRLQPRGPFSYPVDINNAILVMSILLKGYNLEQLRNFDNFAKSILSEVTLSQILQVPRFWMKNMQNMLTFTSPRVIKNTNAVSADLLNFLNNDNDGSIAKTIYSFLKP